MKLHAAAIAIGARAIGPDIDFDRVETDTRKLTPGSLFVALRGERFDGHRFAVKALQQGAAAVMIAADTGLDCSPAMLVDDTRLGLGRLAAWHRSQMPARLAAITGSNGKTTVKEMLASICRATAGDEAVLATHGNFNNDIGMPLTLLGLHPEHRYAVIEMGMNHVGELDYLTRLATPDVALVNNALRAHLEGLGSVAAVARAKAEIYSGLKVGGVAVINADDPHASLWRQLNAGRNALTFGTGEGADVRLLCPSPFSLSTPAGPIKSRLQVPGLHNALNAAAAAATALALGIGPAAIADGLAAYNGSKGRLQTHACLFGATLIDDTYNANPDSVAAAIAVLASSKGQRILVLGDMGELGADTVALHREVGEHARAAGIDRLLCLGELSINAVQAFGAGAMHFERIEELLAELEQALSEGVTVLVKGSRFMQMERVVKSFMEAHDGPHATRPPNGAQCPPQGGPSEVTSCS